MDGSGIPSGNSRNGSVSNTTAHTTSINNNKEGDDEATPFLLIPLSRKNSSFNTTNNNNNNNNNLDDSDVPTNVNSTEQLSTLPAECLSGNEERPLQHFHEDGITISTYSLHPMMYSVFVILLMEGIERFAFYGINYTQTSYLTGEYNPDWNANMNAISASSYVSISVAVAYTTPFLGAYLADQLLGDYWTIIMGIVCCYLPGILLIALTTIPGLLTGSSVDGDLGGDLGGGDGDHFTSSSSSSESSSSSFSGTALAFGLLVLWPTGTGIVKSVVNVFGAKQFHPLLQSSLIESYYVNFYMCINIGALIGGVVVPMLAQTNVTLAYFLPLILLTIGMALFMSRSPRFVVAKPKRNDTTDRIVHFLTCYGCCHRIKPIPKRKSHSYTHFTSSSSSSDAIPISAIFRISLLVVPFNIVYSQMSTTFIVQGTVMKKTLFNLVDAACMNNADAIAVLIFGHVVGTILYPYLADHNIKIPTTYKFAIGSAFGAASILWALMVEYWIITTYEQTGERISILWQGMSYILIGAGEIFAVSAAYEVAFKASPPEQKVLFSAVNLFCIGGLPSVICIILYQLCVPWFQNSNGNMNISHIKEYSTAHINKYFWLLLGLSIFGTLINLLPSIRDFVESIEDRATDMIKTPKTPKFPPTARRKLESYESEESSSSIEEQLLASRRHQYYLKYGSGPSLYKHGSMRAGPALSFTNRNSNNQNNNIRLPSHRSNATSSRPSINRRTLSKLYRSVPVNMMSSTVVMSSSNGQPVTMANALLLSPVTQQRKQNDTSNNSITATTTTTSNTGVVVESSNPDEAIA